MKEWSSLLKNVRRTEAEVDLVKNESNAVLSYSCFHCPSMSASKSSTEKVLSPSDPYAPAGLKFVDSVISHFNVFRAMPLYSLEDIHNHME